MQELKVKVTADIKDLTSQLDRGGISIEQFGKEVAKMTATVGNDFSKNLVVAQNNLRNFENALKKATSGGEVTYLSRNIGILKDQIGALKTGQNNLALGSNQATNALTNFGRVVQDAPYGIIGITNNINPLLESFQRLKAETGSTKKALSALGSSLLGGGGLGLAVSVATSLLTVLATSGFFKTEKAADDATKSVDSFKDAVTGIFSATAKEATEVQSLIAVLKSETATRERKLDTIKELQKINPEVFNGLKIEGNLITGLDAAYQNYIVNLRTVIAVKIKQKQLEDITQKILEKEGAANTKSGQAAIDLLKKFNKEQQSKIQDGKLVTLGTIAQLKEEKALNALYQDQKEFFEQLKDLQAGVKVDTSKDKEKKEQKSVNDIYKDLSDQLLLIRKQFEVGGLSFSEKDIATVKAYANAIDELLKKGANPGDKSIVDLIFKKDPEEDRIALAERIKEVFKTIPKSVENLGLSTLTIPLNIEPSVKIDATKDFIDPKKLEEFRSLIAATMTELFTGIGESIGNIISGKGGIQEAFGALFSTIGNYFQKLGQNMIVASKLMVLLKSSITTLFPAGGIIAGIGLIALGQVMKSLPKFADGITGFGGGTALVGERGPEIVRLPGGSNVIPNHKLNGLSGGGIALSGAFEVSGDKLLLVLDRANQRKRRVA